MILSWIFLPLALAFCIIHAVTSQECGSGTCPSNWVTRSHDNHCYYSSLGSGGSMETYFGARQRCQEDGGDLVIISDNNEYLYIRRKLNDQDLGEHVWIGACWSLTLEWFQYVNGTMMPGSAEWLQGGTLSSNPVFGAVFVIETRDLIDGNTDTKKHYICEKDLCRVSSFPSICSDDRTREQTSNKPTPTSPAVSQTITTVTNQETRTVSTRTDKHSTATIQSSTWSIQITTGKELHVVGQSIYRWIGIGVAAIVVLIIVIILIICIIRRKINNAEKNISVPQENNLSMKTESTEHGTSSDIVTVNVSPTEEHQLKEIVYAEVNAKTSRTLDVGNEKNKNDTAMYATPFKKKDLAKSRGSDEDTSDEDNTEMVENTIYVDT